MTYFLKEPNENSGVEMYSNWNKRFTTGVQQHFWAGRISKLQGRSIEIIQSKEKKKRKINRTSEFCGLSSNILLYT